ncbi:chemotaxis protein CheX [Nocardioides sp. BP30]|uniref:chemotaxis protein CheX n=1 Tax=Nocardioides sp. BP30 TaxID=3036374 RepID=UPI0024683A9A|nr:chemotaxis protein CheX [Nocardioides sp. BP30]WGL51927.1 chemotaxis protein CheX [Nocardioides sp. BP30]
MTITQPSGPELADVHAITEQVWSSFLGDEEPLLPRFDAEPFFPAETVWSAAVSVHGGWTGTVTVELSSGVAQSLTRLMLAMEDEPLDDADVADAVGELVNMVGGNVKSLMPGPSALTLPVVAAGRAAHSSELTEVARFDASWHGEPVRVSVHAPQS